jgi:hypothetical protein
VSTNLRELLKDWPRVYDGLCKRLDDSRPLRHGKRLFLQDCYVDQRVADRMLELTGLYEFYGKQYSSSLDYYIDRYLDVMWAEIEYGFGEGLVVFVNPNSELSS